MWDGGISNRIHASSKEIDHKLFKRIAIAWHTGTGLVLILFYDEYDILSIYIQKLIPKTLLHMGSLASKVYQKSSVKETKT